MTISKQYSLVQSSASVRPRIGSHIVRTQLTVLGGAALQQHFERIRLQKLKRLHDNISGQVGTVVAHPDASHTSTACSLYAGHGIVQYNAPVGRHSHATSSDQ